MRDRGSGRSLRNGFGVHIKTHMNQKVHNQSMCGYDYEADAHVKKSDLIDKSSGRRSFAPSLDWIDSFIHASEILGTLPRNTSSHNFFLFRCLFEVGCGVA